MNPSSLSWPLRVKSTANQMKVAITSPSCLMSSSVSTPDARRPPRPRKATAAVVAGFRACRVGQRERQREDDAGARRIARKRRGDDSIDQEDAIGQPQRGPAEAADEQVADARAEPAFHDRSRDQERQHDEE